MQTKFLLPYRLKLIGWIITILALVLMIAYIHGEFTFSFLDYTIDDIQQISFNNGSLFNIQFNNFTDELGGVLLLTGLLLVAFSKEKDEDERIAKMRLESLLWAVLVNTALILLCILFLYNVVFLQAMAYNICTTLILFIIRFNLVLFFDRKQLNRHEI
jgi:small-conductance mechanosensitive channel